MEHGGHHCKRKPKKKPKIFLRHQRRRFLLLFVVNHFSLHPECRGFESLSAHQFFKPVNINFDQCLQAFFVHTPFPTLKCCSVANEELKGKIGKTLAKHFSPILAPEQLFSIRMNLLGQQCCPLRHKNTGIFFGLDFAGHKIGINIRQKAIDVFGAYTAGQS